MLATTQQAIQEFARHLRRLRETGSIVVLGAQQAVDAANSKLPEDTTTTVMKARVRSDSSKVELHDTPDCAVRLIKPNIAHSSCRAPRNILRLR